MTLPRQERLYNLIPEIYREQDVYNGGPLKALVAIIEREFLAIEDEITGLYDDLFIETCADWLAPYIGDLLGIKGLEDGWSDVVSRRPDVANTAIYRRGKGTLAVLAHVLKDVTGWGAMLVEFVNHLAVTQSMNHIRPGKGGTVNLHDIAALNRVGTPFESSCHTADVRTVNLGSGSDGGRTTTIQGNYNIANLGIFLWRTQSYPVDLSPARKLNDAPDRYMFNSLLRDTALFNQPVTQVDVTSLVREENLPVALRRRVLADELDDIRQAWVDGESYMALYFGEAPAIEVYLDGDDKLISPRNIEALDLSDWNRPPAYRSYKRTSDGQSVDVPIIVGVDPELGRLTFPEGKSHEQVEVSHSYGFSANIGGGPYDRRQSLAEPSEDTWFGRVSSELPRQRAGWHVNIEDAIADWRKSSKDGIIEIVDNGIYHLGAPVEGDGNPAMDISLLPSKSLTIQAEQGKTPTLVGSIVVNGGDYDSHLRINGVLIDGQVQLEMNGKVTLEDSTIWDSSTRSRHSETPSIEGSAGHAPNATLLRCIVRSIRLSSQSDLAVKDSIIDGGQGRAIGPIAGEEHGPSVKIDSGTILGETAVQAIEATDSIFDGNVTVARMQIGYLRYCYAPDGSKTPRRFHCQPDLTTEGANETERRQIRIWLKPSFTSRIVGAPGYAQLRQNCPVQIKTGAEIGSEMGVFGMLHQPKRAARIKTALDEYMYYGLNPGVFYVDHYMPHPFETDPARISNRPDQD